MKMLRTLVRKLFTFRKIMWLFLAGMLVISEEAVAQQTEGKGASPADKGRPAVTEPNVKYGPPPSTWSIPQNKGGSKKKNAKDAATARAERKRQREMKKNETIKYGPASTVTPKL